MKQFIADRHTVPGTPSLEQVPTEKIPVYDTKADAEADLANLAEDQIVATKDAGADAQTLIEYVDGRLETTTTEIAMDVIKTGSKAQLNRSGNNVQFHYVVFDATTFNPQTESVWTTIGTIPAGFRPKQEIQINGQGTQPDGKPPYMIRLEPTGEVQIWKYPDIGFGWTLAIDVDYNVVDPNSHGMTVNTLKDAKDYTDSKLATVVPITKNLNSVNTTATMDYYDCIRTILSDNNISSWDVGTYMGTFTSSGVSPNIWCGTYLLTKTHTGDYGTMVIGNANGQAFTATNATGGWQVRIENALVNRSANGNFIETCDTQTNRINNLNQHRCYVYGKGPMQEFIDFIQKADYANIRASNGIIAFACNGTPNIYGKNKYDLNGPWTQQYTGTGALWYYLSPKFYCPASAATTDWHFFVESAWDNIHINPADWIAAGNAQVFVSIEVIK